MLVWFAFIALPAWMGHAANTEPPAQWTRLYAFRPHITCGDDLMHATDPNVVTDGPAEVTALLNLSDPWIQNYLALNTRPRDPRNRAFHVDVRVLALIYGDQPAFELKHRGGERAFDRLERDMVDWPRLPSDVRRDVATRVVSYVAHLDWRVRDTKSFATVYLDGFTIDRAFHGEALRLWASMIARWWDVNDVDDVALDLHRRIYAVRTRLAGDPNLRAALIQQLTAAEGLTNLPNVTLSARRFTRGFAAELEREPAPDWSWVRNSHPRSSWLNPSFRRR